MSCDNCGNPYATEQRPWTTEPPTEPGWYWAKPQPDLIDDDPCIAVRVRPWDDHLDVYVTGTDQAFALNCFTHWMRIERPEAPK